MTFPVEWGFYQCSKQSKTCEKQLYCSYCANQQMWQCSNNLLSKNDIIQILAQRKGDQAAVAYVKMQIQMIKHKQEAEHTREMKRISKKTGDSTTDTTVTAHKRHKKAKKKLFSFFPNPI